MAGKNRTSDLSASVSGSDSNSGPASRRCRWEILEYIKNISEIWSWEERVCKKFSQLQKEELKPRLKLITSEVCLESYWRAWKLLSRSYLSFGLVEAKLESDKMWGSFGGGLDVVWETLSRWVNGKTMVHEEVAAVYDGDWGWGWEWVMVSHMEVCDWLLLFLVILHIIYCKGPLSYNLPKLLYFIFL